MKRGKNEIKTTDERERQRPNEWELKQKGRERGGKRKVKRVRIYGNSA